MWRYLLYGVAAGQSATNQQVADFEHPANDAGHQHANASRTGWRGHHRRQEEPLLSSEQTNTGYSTAG